ncbi:hypothetical protein LCGC14_1964460 [marine sediment metagenome]|uniref:Uncharacterized protein n=1 Tax=marine sediment metagenome TaxID=412755 RepID=A0A0F9G211_9ZZZZ
MTYIIKRKLQGVLGDDVDTNEMAALIQHTQDSAVEYIVNQDSLTVNNLVVKKTNKIPVGTDKYPAANPSSTAISSVIETKDIVSNNLNVTYNCIKLADGFYMMGYRDNDFDGHVVTFALTESTGNIGGTVDWEFLNAETAASVSIIKISGTTYAIVYSAAQSANIIRVGTFTVSDAGVITKSFIDSLTLPVTNDEPQMGSDIIHISGDVYAIVYSEMASVNPSLGVVVTVTIDSAGAISNSVVDSLDFAAVSRGDVSIVKVGTTDFYAIAYLDNSSDPVVTTVDIDSAGAIAAAVTDTQVLANITGATGNIVRVPGTDFYAVIVDNFGNPGTIYTVSISSSGAITIKGSGFYDLNTAGSGRILAVRDNLFTVVYSGVDNDGFIVTVPINSDGTVGAIADSPRPCLCAKVNRGGKRSAANRPIQIAREGLGAISYDDPVGSIS